MKKLALVSVLPLLAIISCTNPGRLVQYGKHFQKYHDYKSLNQVVNLIEQNADQAYLKNILGEPIDMGFDYRYLVDSTGENGCPIGAVFHFSEKKIVDDLWIGEICE